MTTLNARANQAWQEAEFFASEQAAFEEGWETGYKTASREMLGALEERSRPLPTEVEIAERVRQIFIDGGAHRTHAQEAASEIADAVLKLMGGAS